MIIFNRFYSQKRFVKDSVMSVNINPSLIDEKYFCQIMVDNFDIGIRYSIMYKVKYNGSRYSMLSSQEGFYMLDNSYSSAVEILYMNFKNGFIEFLNYYDVHYINMIQILYVVIEGLPKLGVSNVSGLGLNKNFLNINETQSKFNNKFLPLTTNTNYFGKLLEGNKRVKYFDVINRARNLLILNNLDVDSYTSIYLYLDKYIILNYTIGYNVYGRDMYDAYTGKYLITFKDTVLNVDTFSREKGGVSFLISKDKVVQLFAKKELNIIKYNSKPYKESANAFIGCIDLETYKDIDGVVKVYSLGFVTQGDNPIIYYISKNQSSDNLVLRCLDNILINKYDGYTFYIHNFGGYDSIFILATLERYNTMRGYDYYMLEPLYRDNDLLRLTIKVRIDDSYNKIREYTSDTNSNGSDDITTSLIKNNDNDKGKNIKSRYIKIKIVDSLAIFNMSLSKLSMSFNLGVTKGNFPHRFVNNNTFYYLGEIPSYYYWDNITKNDHKSMSKANKLWNLKDECIKYLIKDLTSLLVVMDTFNKHIYKNYDLQLTDCSTISRLALSIFLKSFLNTSCIPIITSNMYNDIRQSYFGGITEVYKPYGKNLYYYDVNSLYPYAALNSIPGRKCVYREDYTDKGLNLKELFGFFYCDIETSDSYLGLLPVRHETGVFMPNGRWSGWYFSEELKFAFDNGYKIKVIKGYNFDKSNNVFDNYVKHFYEIKSNNTNYLNVIAKSLLNNLLGRFGININKPVTKLVDVKKLAEIQATRVIESYPKPLSDKKYIISYYPEISREICEAHNLDFHKIYADSIKSDMERSGKFNDVSISTASAVTGYARIYMSKLKLDLLKNNFNIYYSDTDSIVVDKPLDDSLVGCGIGLFKLEHKVKRAYFISNKTYCLIPFNKDPILKLKGGINTSFSVSDFVNMYKGISVQGKKNNSKTFIKDGYVDISKDTLNINYDSFRKRVKIYDNDKWVDTKPCSI